MTRWIQGFDKHPFKSSWSALLEDVVSLDVDDQTVTTTVEELARLKKVLAFVDSIISNADLELTPMSVWTSSNSQSDACLQKVRAYASSRNAVYLVQANEHADNLLTYVRPYMVPPAQALEAYGVAVRKFSDQVSEYIESFQNKASTVRVSLAAARDEALAHKNEIEAIEKRVKEFEEYVFVGVDGCRPADGFIRDMVSEVQAKHDAVKVLHQELSEGSASTSVKIFSFAQTIKDMNESLEEVLGSTTSKQNELEVFYERIFGHAMHDDQEVQDSGLRRELELRLEQLESYEAEQKSRQLALFKSVESLLPGATSAGLASAYKTLKDHFESPIKWYTRAFYGSMLVLLFGGLVLVTESFSLLPFQMEFVKASGWEEMLRTLLVRVPVILPVVWVAIFSATRRSQYERLQQEYAHKEAFAASYESYKKQLQALQVDADDLQKELIAKAIETISFNASKTLDGKHAEKLPMFQLLEKLNVDELKKLMDFARGK